MTFNTNLNEPLGMVYIPNRSCRSYMDRPIHRDAGAAGVEVRIDQGAGRRDRDRSCREAVGKLGGP
ncbi:MAG: hypothetical protein QOH35_2104 [Acidobacteriaceae bacterium]|jgi:hypothetical protein|nr:hypothetical protein [Acidobacteriaceae bacterium]